MEKYHHPIRDVRQYLPVLVSIKILLEIKMLGDLVHSELWGTVPAGD